MANSLTSLLFGQASTRSDLVEAITPRRTFADVILPPATRRALENALTQIEKHDLIFNGWGLAERHSVGLGLAFNFAGPPGTGKTICAEAVAHALGRRLFVVRYADLESMWMGATGKNVTSVFRLAEEEDAVLFFDEADAIAGRRFTAIQQGYQRETNTVVNILLREVETFPGVVIFATNLAANFDPAFERRIRTHILFTMPDAEERERIWQVQLHPHKTPLAADVDFRALAEQFEVSGGDIKNAVLKAAQRAMAEPGPDRQKKIHQRHFIEAMQEVLAGRRVMEQSLFRLGEHPPAAPLPSGLLLDQLSHDQDVLQEEVKALTAQVEQLGIRFDVLENHLLSVQQALAQRRQEEQAALEAYHGLLQDTVEATEAAWRRSLRVLLYLALAALVLGCTALVLALLG